MNLEKAMFVLVGTWLNKTQFGESVHEAITSCENINTFHIYMCTHTRSIAKGKTGKHSIVICVSKNTC